MQTLRVKDKEEENPLPTSTKCYKSDKSFRINYSSSAAKGRGRLHHYTAMVILDYTLKCTTEVFVTQH